MSSRSRPLRPVPQARSLHLALPSGSPAPRPAPGQVATRLWLALCLTDFPLHALSRALSEGPLAVTHGAAGRRRLLACNEPARNAGLAQDMLLSAAYALCPELLALARDEQRERQALDGLAAWALQFTSLLSPVAGRGLLLEVRGSLRLFGGLEPLYEAIRRGLTELGYPALMAVAPTPTAAWLLARAGIEVRLHEPHRLSGVLATVPLAALDLPARGSERLAGMGVRCFADLQRLPRDGLGRRLGQAVLDLLDRALGRVPEPLSPFVPPAVFDSRLVLPSEVWDSEALLYALQRLLRELSGYLLARGLGVQGMDWFLMHRGHADTRLGIGLLGPNRQVGHLLGLCKERLDSIRLPAAVEEMRLTSVSLAPLVARVGDLFGTHAEVLEDWPSLLERLRARLGEEAIWGLAVVADHRPERAWRRGVPGAGDASGEGRVQRPLWLLAEPRRLEQSRGRPCYRGVLRLLRGPERIENGWWDGRDVARDYFVALNPAGLRLWVFRQRAAPHAWYLHGLFA